MKKIVALVLSLVMVLGLATTAFAAAEVTFSYVDSTTGKFTPLWTYAAKDLDDFVADDDNYVACYKVEDAFYVEVTAASATHCLTYGAKTVYLVAVPETSVKFENKAVALTVVGELDDATCGEFYDTAYDEDYEYYVTYDKKGNVVAVYVADEDANTNVLVNGKLVAAVEVDTVDKLGHNYVGNDVVNYEYTTVKCLNCGKVANLYANATAAGKDAQKVTSVGKWITFADMFTYGVVAAPEASEKVESAETFDAGIAMYVGMSVMAAAGSAVVLKKKD